MSFTFDRRSPLGPETFTFVAATACALAIACSSSSSSSSTPNETPEADASTSSAKDASSEASSSRDAALDAPTEEPCDGDCLKTTLEADIGGKKASLDRAQYGTDGTGAAQGLYIEANVGGDTACPTKDSPTPERLLILTGIPIGAVGTKLTEADGVTASYLDYVGDQLPDKPTTKATAVEATLVEIDSGTPPAWVAVDVRATFAEGTVQGHVFASYCQTMSE